MTITLDGTLGITSPAETVQGALTTTGNTILGDATTDTLNVGAGGLVKDASGNVGIGTASPTSKLDVVTNGATRAGSFTGNGLEVKHPTLPSNFFAGTQTGSDVKLASEGAYPMLFYTNSTEQARIDSAGLFKFNSGYGSAATAYGCRAWVNFNGTGTVAIRASGNVSSITDNGTGAYTVNFTTAMPDVNYCFVSGRCGSGSGGTSPAVSNGSTSQLVGSVAIISIQGNNTVSDQEYLTLGIFR